MQIKYLNSTNTITTCKNGTFIEIYTLGGWLKIVLIYFIKNITLNPGSYHSVCIS